MPVSLFSLCERSGRTHQGMSLKDQEDMTKNMAHGEMRSKLHLFS